MKVRRTSFARRRSTIALPGLKGIKQLIKSVITGGLVFLMLGFGINLIAKYLMTGRAAEAPKTAARKAPEAKLPPAAEKAAQEKKSSRVSAPFSLFAKPLYFMVKDNFYIVYSSGKTELVSTNIDTASLPVISGIKLDEDRPAHKAAFRAALAVKPSNMENIAEVSLADPENIILLSVDGARIYLGDFIDNEKMENLQAALEHRESKYKSADLRYKDRVIIK